MGILDGIVGWIAEQVMNLLDLISTAILGALGCDMSTFERYFPAAQTMYDIFVWTGIGLVLLNMVWSLFRGFGAGLEMETEDPVKLVIRSLLFILLIWFAAPIVDTVLAIGGTSYEWIMSASLPGIQFANFNSVLLVVIGVLANGSVALIVLILILILAWGITSNCFLRPASDISCLGSWCSRRRQLWQWVQQERPTTSSRAGAGCSAVNSFCFA